MSAKTFHLILLFTSLCFGTIMGAYFTTLEYRMRTNLPLLSSDCICPTCHRKLSLLHQIPIVSYLILRGKCYYCHVPIPLRYPLIETVFLLYYTATYIIFRNHPVIYLSLWFLFMTAALISRGHRHLSALLRAVGISCAYHLTISFFYLIIYWTNHMQ